MRHAIALSLSYMLPAPNLSSFVTSVKENNAGETGLEELIFEKKRSSVQ